MKKNYQYIAVDCKGAIRSGCIRLGDTHLVQQHLIKKCWMVLSVEEVETDVMNSILSRQTNALVSCILYCKSMASKLKLPLQFLRRKRLSSKQILRFTQSITSLLHSGLSLAVVLRVMFEEESSFIFKKVLKKMISDMEEGISFSEALMLSKFNWGGPYIQAIQAADCCGRLEEILDMLQGELERKVEFEDKLRTAMVYPVFVLVLSIAVVSLVLLFVVPQFSNMLNYLAPNAVLPFGTRMVLSLSEYLCNAGFNLILLLLAFGLIVITMLQTYSARQYIYAIFQSLPFIGRTLRLIEIQRMLHALKILMASGVHIMDALSQVQIEANSISIKSALIRISERILGGVGFAEAICMEKIFPLWLKDNLKIAEQSGALDEMLKKSADTAKAEIERKLKLALTFIEPLLVLGLSVVIGSLVVCLFWPILEVVRRMSEL